MEPLLKLMEQNTTMMTTMMNQSKKDSENSMANIAKIFESQLEMAKVNATNESKLRETVHKTSTDLLMKHIDRLQAAAETGKSDFMTEFKKFKAMKELLGEGGERSTDFRTILADNFDRVPEIIESVGDLLRGGPAQPPPQQAATQTAGLPPPRRPKRPPASPEAAAAGKKQVEFTMKISRLTSNAETAIETGMDVASFVSKYVAPEFDKEDLARMASVAPDDMIKILANRLPDNSPLLTTAGRDFLRGVHLEIKNRFKPS
jgi:hypothetical protein